MPVHIPVLVFPPLPLHALPDVWCCWRLQHLMSKNGTEYKIRLRRPTVRPRRTPPPPPTAHASQACRVILKRLYESKRGGWVNAAALGKFSTDDAAVVAAAKRPYSDRLRLFLEAHPSMFDVRVGAGHVSSQPNAYPPPFFLSFRSRRVCQTQARRWKSGQLCRRTLPSKPPWMCCASVCTPVGGQMPQIWAVSPTHEKQPWLPPGRRHSTTGCGL